MSQDKEMEKKEQEFIHSKPVLANAEINQSLNTSRRRIGKILPAFLVTGGVALFLVGSSVLYVTLKNSKQVQGAFDEFNIRKDTVRYCLDVFQRSQKIEVIPLDENHTIEVYGDPQDKQLTERVAHIHHVIPLLKQQMISFHIIPQKVNIYVTDKDPNKDDIALTMSSSKIGEKNIFLGQSSDESDIHHELIHALYQTEQSKNHPTFISEGIVYYLAQQRPKSSIALDPSFFVQHVRGLFAENGDIVTNNSDIPKLQYLANQNFWEELSRVDPTIISKLLTYHQNFAGKINDIPALLLEVCDPSQKEKVEEFLHRCSLFHIPQKSNYVCYPSISEKNKPKITFLLLDKNQKHIETPCKGWYQSSINGNILSKKDTEPFEITSGDVIEFSKYELQDGFIVEVWMQQPDNTTPHYQKFVYHQTSHVFDLMTP